MRMRSIISAALAFFGYYEAGERWNPARRSYIPGFVQDARFDILELTRLEIVRKARYFEANNAYANRMADLMEQYTSGPSGIQVTSCSSDDEWNRKSDAWFSEWCTFCDLTSRLHFGTLQSMAVRCWFVDGEVFILKTSGRERPDQQSFPRIQLVESHRVQTPPDRNADKNIIDGVQVDDRGRPIGYWVRDTAGAGPFGPLTTTYEFVPADRMLHLFEPGRPGQYRGLPMLTPVMNDLQDLDDLQILEMSAAKQAARTTRVIKTKTGELPNEDLIRKRLNLGNKTTNPNGTSGGNSLTRDEYYKQVFGAEAAVLKKDDEYDEYVSQRPSVAVQAYWEHIISKICAGTGMSKLLVIPFSMQGTVTRADLDVANQFFRSRSAVLSVIVGDIRDFVMSWAINNVRDLADPPADWRKKYMRPPRSVNVDVGRNSNALIQEYREGFRPLQSICEDFGDGWRSVLEQRAVERKYAQMLEQKEKLAPGSLLSPDVHKMSQPQPEAPEKEEKEEKTDSPYAT